MHGRLSFIPVGTAWRIVRSVRRWFIDEVVLAYYFLA